MLIAVWYLQRYKVYYQLKKQISLDEEKHLRSSKMRLEQGNDPATTEGLLAKKSSLLRRYAVVLFIIGNIFVFD